MNQKSRRNSLLIVLAVFALGIILPAAISTRHPDAAAQRSAPDAAADEVQTAYAPQVG